MATYLLSCSYSLASGQYYGGYDESDFPASWQLTDYEFEAANDDEAVKTARKLLRRPPTQEMKGHRYDLCNIRLQQKPVEQPPPIEVADVPREVSF